MISEKLLLAAFKMFLFCIVFTGGIKFVLSRKEIAEEKRRQLRSMAGLSAFVMLVLGGFLAVGLIMMLVSGG